MLMKGQIYRKQAILSAFVALIVVAAPVAGLEPLGFDDPARQARYEALLHQLRCVVCQNQSLASSDAGLAGDLRQRVHQMVAEDQTNDAIKTHLIERYGDFVLYRPPVTARTYVLWFSAPVLLLAGIIVLAVTVHRRHHLPPRRLDANEHTQLRRVLSDHRNDVS